MVNSRLSQSLILLALAAVGPVQVGLASSESDVHLDRALQYEMKGNIDGATAEYKRCLELDPNSVDGHTHLGLLKLQQNGDVDGAISEFVTALGIDPQCQFCQNRLNEAVDIRNSNSTVNLNKANDFYRLGQLSRAVGAYKIALYLEPGNAEAHNSLAWTLYRTGKLEQALAEVQTALRLKPEEPEYLNTLACVLYDKGDLDASIGQFEKAISRSKKANPADLYGLAVSFLSKGEKQRAVERFKEALASDPKYADAKYLRDRIGMSAHTLAFHEQLLALSGWKEDKPQQP